MITAKDITVVFPCVYENFEPIWMMTASCKRFGIVPKPYGFGRTYSGWQDIMLRQLMKAAKECPTSHMLYTDSRDAFFLVGINEIAMKYNAMGAPNLMIGADTQGFSTYQKWYDRVPWDMKRAFPYFQVGGMLCRAESLYKAIHWMYQRCDSGDWGAMPGDNPPWWCNFMVENPGCLVIDHHCRIFQNATNVMEYLRVGSTGVYNEITRTLPCVLHFQGGYTDQLKGKWDRMEPLFRALGYTENPPWEGR